MNYENNQSTMSNLKSYFNLLKGILTKSECETLSNEISEFIKLQKIPTEVNKVSENTFRFSIKTGWLESMVSDALKVSSLASRLPKFDCSNQCSL